MSDHSRVRWEGNSGGIWVSPAHSRADFQARPSCSRLVQSRFEYLPGWRPTASLGLSQSCSALRRKNFLLMASRFFPCSSLFLLYFVLLLCVSVNSLPLPK